MLNDNKYKIPTQTTPENQMLFIINGLEQKVKKLTIQRDNLSEACKDLIKSVKAKSDWKEYHALIIPYAEQTIHDCEK